jgi:ATP-binding cassette subfamily G (WHITE) protein 2 (SNQ2)
MDLQHSRAPNSRKSISFATSLPWYQSELKVPYIQKSLFNGLFGSGPSYSDVRYQTCTLAGSTPGTAIVPGISYSNALFGVEKTHIWRGVGVLFAFTFFFLAGTLIASELVAFGLGGRTTKFYIKEDKRRKELNDNLQENKANPQGNGGQDQAQLEIKSKSTLTWENLTYDVPTAAGPKRLLNYIDGYVQPGHLTALMGASG